MMIKFFLGTVFGIAVATVGFTGLAGMADRSVDATKTFIQEKAAVTKE